MARSLLKGRTVEARLFTAIEGVESAALDQLRNIASLPWTFHVAAMPDVHLGKGATVGSVIAMRNAVSPAAVGVDIGCGMAAVRFDLDSAQLPDTLRDVRLAIEAAVPVGFNAHDGSVWAEFEETKRAGQKLMEDFCNLTPAVHSLEGRANAQLGTLGGGNHFIELHEDEAGAVWLVLHSGSRNIGKELAEHHIRIAKKLAHNERIPDRELSVFLAGTPEMEAYRFDLYWAQRWAALNREVMLRRSVRAVAGVLGRPLKAAEMVACHHNYVAEEVHYGEEVFVTRKGAIRAGVGELGIIPGSMGSSTFIVRGKGNEEALCSAPHGAGRKMSRGAAKRAFSVEDLASQTAGVECRKDEGIIDEAPKSYKDIDIVMEESCELVEVVHKLGPKPLLCVKG